ncbi:MAG: GspE/PulE family protein [Syntrophomonadaceae bacterium]
MNRDITSIQTGQEARPGIPAVSLVNTDIQKEALRLLPYQMIRSQNVLPVSRTRNSVTVAMADPWDHRKIDDVRLITGLEVIPVLAPAAEIETAVRNVLAFHPDPGMEILLAELGELLDKETRDSQESRSISIHDYAPVVRMVNLLLKQAVAAGSSDVHIEPQVDSVRVRLRVDGELYPVMSFSRSLLLQLVSRLKIMAGMDIAEKRVPQDGRFQLEVDSEEVDFRLSTLPTSHGEKIAIRVLDRRTLITGPDQLGLSPKNMDQIRRLTQRLRGMILVTGSTGSGKTTTLYALLQEMDSTGRNIITLEDPVEYTLAGINQVQINPKAGLDFSAGLGSILRQDPDIIMVGEIRDQATARLAVRAALTGHLVLSTLHTNSAASSVARLADMGIEPFLLATSLNGVVAQRLVRRLCVNCRRPYVLDEARAVMLGIPGEAGGTFFAPTGCNLCRQIGYRGRLALQEVMVAGPYVRRAVHGAAEAEGCRSEALRDGMIPMREDALDKARQGLTSLEEVMKAVMEED